ncbi:interleukin-9 [Trichechus manatus latirostris]|uniref:Interleukin-9 n=1 Tax=Trichechus manatus latirostris TaxID=127582 RepID=A0A2Y9E1V7_TRIMA|nr:interleukin-9 [Trichechus manatus latirostris]
MLLTTVLASALFICSTAGKTCFSLWGVRDVSYLIQKLQEHPTSQCSCSTSVTDGLCLPVPSDNCTTPCFQEGLSQLTNNTAYSEFRLNFNRVKKTVEDLQRKNCQTFSCEQPCNQTTTGNTLTFLKRLLHAFQKESNRGTV